MRYKATSCAALLLLAAQVEAVSQEIQTTENSDQKQAELRECHGLGCGHVRPISDKNPYGIDLGWGGAVSYSGVPTRALAMAKAQLVFSGEQCPKPSKLKKTGFPYMFLGSFGSWPKRDYLKPFSEAVDKFKENYEKAWLTLDGGQRDAFCEKYLADATFNVKEFKVFPSEFYALYLSPLSDEGIQEFEVKMKRVEKLKWLALFGQVLSVAAQVSAAHDSIQTGNSALREGAQGDIGAMNTQMSQSKALFSESTNFYNLGNHFYIAGSTLGGDATTGAMSHLKGNLSTNLKCQALTHFSQWDAPPDAEIWRTYQSLVIGCEALDQLRID